MKIISTVSMIFIVTLYAYTGASNCNLKDQQVLISDRIKGSIFGGLIGDALGRPTEFIHTTAEIFKKYPRGITSFEDLKKFKLCWKNSKTQQLFAPYTDDTAMTRLTLKVLLESRSQNWDLDKAMTKLALSYVADMNNPTGWAMPDRAPGLTCLKSVKKLRDLPEDGAPLPKDWWKSCGDEKSAGCGSVMRAHAFGLVFADDPEKAATWAAQHSKITHGHPMAQASCAAMAIGVAYAVQGKDPDFIIEQMIAWAKKYDPVKTRYNPHSKQEEKSTWAKIEHAVELAKKTEEDLQEALWDFYFNDYKAMTHAILHNVLYPCSKKYKIFDIYQGWAADDAIAATAYIFALTPKCMYSAVYLGVHTPGDSDSIASMAGALVGAHDGTRDLLMWHNPEHYEGSFTLQQYAEQAAQFIAQ